MKKPSYVEDTANKTGQSKQNIYNKVRTGEALPQSIRDDIRDTPIAERKRIYEAMHPETRHGGAGGLARQNSATEIISFAKDTAQKTGMTDRSIRQKTRTPQALPQSIRDDIRDTPIADSGIELDTLSKSRKNYDSKHTRVRQNGESTREWLVVILTTNLKPSLEFDNREQVKLWMIENQLGRRNLTRQQIKDYRGRYYGAHKLVHGTNRFTNSKSGKSCHPTKTRETVAKKWGGQNDHPTKTRTPKCYPKLSAIPIVTKQFVIFDISYKWLDF